MRNFLFLLILLPTCGIFFLKNAYAVIDSQHFPLSLAATQQAIAQWLDLNEQNYRIIQQPGGLVHIRSSKKNEQWRIELSRHSPLATTVTVYHETRKNNDFKITALLQYLGSKNATESHLEELQPEIPAAVLDKIGTVVCIKAERRGQTYQFSGIAIDEKGLILSTAHDLKEQEKVTIVSTINTMFQGDIIKIDFTRDLALIQIKSGSDQVINIDEGHNLLSMGEKLYSIGCPVGLRGTISSGYINGPPRISNNLPIWQAHIDIQPGSSGSPVFDSKGDFVALVKGRHRVSEEIGFLIPLEVIIDFLGEQLTQ